MSLTKIHLAATLLLAVPVAAQSTLPAGFETTEGASLLSVIGASADSRHQIVYRSLQGGGAKTLSEMSFRRDGAQASTAAVGRSWTNVQIQIAEADMLNFDTTFANNFGTAPVTVFSGAVTWDDATTAPGSSPMPWNAGGLDFKFTTPFNYSGNGELLIDIQFSGGTLANAAPWTGRESYHLDAETSVTRSGGSGRSVGPLKATHPCVTDTTSPFAFGPWVLALVTTNGKITVDPAHASTFALTRAITFGPPNTDFLTVLSANGTDSMTPTAQFPAIFGALCQHLMVDTSMALRYEMFKTNFVGQAQIPLEYIPFDASAVGKTLYTQGIWMDTVTKQPKLTRGGVSMIPPQPADAKFIALGAHANPTAPAARLVSGSSIPMILWK